jgi:hypothetical protein
MFARDPSRELQRMFSGLIEQVFMAELGVCAPALTDYLARLLADFVHVDRIYRMRNVDGEVIREISRLQAEAEVGVDLDEHERERIVQRYIGDFSLFWTGVYPETLRLRRGAGVDRFREYVLQGKRGYELAGELTGRDDVPPADLLHDLSVHFEPCMHGLHLVRENWEQPGRGPRQN